LATAIAISSGIRIRRGVIGSLYLPERSMKQASRDKRGNRNRLISHSPAMSRRGRINPLYPCRDGRRSLQSARPNDIMQPE